MLKKIRKNLRQRHLAAALALAMAIAAPATPAYADIGPQSFSDRQPHTVTDNIVANGTRGLAVNYAGTNVAMSGHSITTTGSVSPGVDVTFGGALILNSVTIQTYGPNSIGLLSQGGASITMTGGSVTVNASNSYGSIVANAIATITLNGVSVTTTGDDNAGCNVIADSAIFLTNSTIQATGAGSYALLADRGGGTINATVSGQEISGTGGLIKADGGSSIVNITASGFSRLSGITTLMNGGTANLALSGDSDWTMPGTSSLTTLTLNGGTVTFATPSSGGYKTLEVMGTLSGSGGAFNINANPGTGQSDLVRINGASSGNHQLFVAIQGGAANLYQVVKVVDLNDAAINTATFSGGSDVGAYRYGIARGAAVPAGYSGVGSMADYFLYNTFIASTPAAAAVSAAASPGVLWYGEMNDIKKRMGELRLGASSDDFWARAYAGKYNVKPGGGQPFDQLMHGIEIGKDRPIAIAGGKHYLGWVAGAGKADNTFGTGGSGATNSFYLGAYGSWLKDDGSYLDIVGKHNWFHSRFDSPILGGGGDSAAYKNTGFGLSVETGKRIEKDGGVFVEPQAELAALWTQGKNYTTAGGLAVRALATTSLQLRLGAVAGRKLSLADGGSRQIYGKLSWVEELNGQNHTTVDTASFESSLKGGRLVAGVGFVEDTATRQLYLDLETAWGKTTSKPWGVNLGCRWKL